MTEMNVATVPEAQAVADIVRQHVKADPQTLKTPKEGEAPVLILPTTGGLKVESVKKFIDEYRAAPERKTGTAWSADLNSFIAHVNRFKDEDSAVFADPVRDVPKLTAVIDYHKQDGSPRFGEHRIIYAFPLSDEWTAWNGQSEQTMPQADFAEFLEDRIIDVEAPPDLANAPLDDEPAKRLADLIAKIGGNLAGPGKLMDLSRGLKVNIQETVQNAQTLASGETQIQFTHEHQDEKGAPLKVPNIFLIAIPVFKNGPLYRIPVRLRYRARGGQIAWSFILYQPERAFDNAFDESLDRVGEETGLPVYRGGPEH